MTDHPMQPTPEQIGDWLANAPTPIERLHRAYAAGADAQLSADVEWLRFNCSRLPAERLYANMRPKPPSLAEQALVALDDISNRIDAAHENIIRRALESLNDSL